MNGINLLTILALLCGLYVHTAKQIRNAKKLDVKVTYKSYFADNLGETITSFVCSLVGYLALPELAAHFPEMAKMAGLSADHTVLSSFIVGYMGNSLADFLGGRVEKLSGG
jgi:hypothetical protein